MDSKNTWSDWMDFDENIISVIPKSAGVYMMHSSMKILMIEGASDIKKGIKEKLSLPCITNNTRLRYMKTESYQKIADDLIRDYKNRHEDTLPSCMQG